MVLEKYLHDSPVSAAGELPRQPFKEKQVCMQASDKLIKEIQQARLKIEGMRQARRLEDFEELWKEFLRCLERVWYKATHHYSRSPKWNGWKAQFEQPRKKDPLLSYLVNARGADEHTVEEITDREPSAIAINPAKGTSLFIKEMVINGNEITIDSPQEILIEFIPGKVRLLPVKNYGRVYHPPTLHLGKPIDPSYVIEVAELGIRFYEEFLERAEKYFVK